MNVWCQVFDKKEAEGILQFSPASHLACNINFRMNQRFVFGESEAIKNKQKTMDKPSENLTSKLFIGTVKISRYSFSLSLCVSLSSVISQQYGSKIVGPLRVVYVHICTWL